MASKQTLTRLYDFVPDWLWPHLKGDKECPPEYQYRGGVTEPLLDQVERQLDLIENDQGQRGQTVGTKLMALLTLSLILSTGIIGGLTAIVAFGNTEVLSCVIMSAYITAIVIVFYILIQRWIVLWNVISGLTRRGYMKLCAEDIAPTIGENESTYRKRILNARIYNTDYNNWVINRKVSDMAVAHRAYKNMLGGVLTLIVTIAIIIVIKMIA